MYVKIMYTVCIGTDVRTFFFLLSKNALHCNINYSCAQVLELIHLQFKLLHKCDEVNCQDNKNMFMLEDKKRRLHSKKKSCFSYIINTSLLYREMTRRCGTYFACTYFNAISFNGNSYGS